MEKQRLILPSLKGYKLSFFKNDLIAGIVVAALTIPVAMGYAEIAGLPPVYGLYCSILPVVGYALFASSRQLIYGMDAAASAITGSMLAFAGIAMQSDDAIMFAPMLSLFAGAFLIVLAILKLGRFAKFISNPVMSGFISGLGIAIIFGQIPKLIEAPSQGTDFIPNVESIIQGIGVTNFFSLGMGVAAIVIILLSKKFLPKVPMALVVLVLATAASALFSLDQQGITIVGEIPLGLPPLFIPDSSTLEYLPIAALGGLVAAIVIFADSLLDTNSFALQGGYKVNDNRELMAFGISNLAAGVSGCSPTSGSVSRTAASVEFRGKTQMVSLVAAVVILLVVLFLGNLLYYMPQAVLAGIIIAALIGVVDIKTAISLFKASRMEFAIWLVSAGCVLVIGILPGVIIGVALSFVDVIVRAVAPPNAYLGRIKGKDGYYDLERNRDAKPVDTHTVIYRFSAPLFFANFGAFKEGIKHVSKSNPKRIIIDASAITGIDTTAAEQLGTIIKEEKEKGTVIYFAGAIRPLAKEMEVTGLKDYVDQGYVTKTIEDALKASADVLPHRKHPEESSAHKEISPESSAHKEVASKSSTSPDSSVKKDSTGSSGNNSKDK